MNELEKNGITQDDVETIPNIASEEETQNDAEKHNDDLANTFKEYGIDLSKEDIKRISTSKENIIMVDPNQIVSNASTQITSNATSNSSTQALVESKQLESKESTQGINSEYRFFSINAEDGLDMLSAMIKTLDDNPSQDELNDIADLSDKLKAINENEKQLHGVYDAAEIIEPKEKTKKFKTTPKKSTQYLRAKGASRYSASKQKIAQTIQQKQAPKVKQQTRNISDLHPVKRGITILTEIAEQQADEGNEILRKHTMSERVGRNGLILGAGLGAGAGIAAITGIILGPVAGIAAYGIAKALAVGTLTTAVGGQALKNPIAHITGQRKLEENYYNAIKKLPNEEFEQLYKDIDENYAREIKLNSVIAHAMKRALKEKREQDITNRKEKNVKLEEELQSLKEKESKRPLQPNEQLRYRQIVQMQKENEEKIQQDYKDKSRTNIITDILSGKYKGNMDTKFNQLAYRDAPTSKFLPVYKELSEASKTEEIGTAKIRKSQLTGDKNLANEGAHDIDKGRREYRETVIQNTRKNLFGKSIGLCDNKDPNHTNLEISMVEDHDLENTARAIAGITGLSMGIFEAKQIQYQFEQLKNSNQALYQQFTDYIKQVQDYNTKYAGQHNIKATPPQPSQEMLQGLADANVNSIATKLETAGEHATRGTSNGDVYIVVNGKERTVSYHTYDQLTQNAITAQKHDLTNLTPKQSLTILRRQLEYEKNNADKTLEHAVSVVREKGDFTVPHTTQLNIQSASSTQTDAKIKLLDYLEKSMDPKTYSFTMPNAPTTTITTPKAMQFVQHIAGLVTSTIAAIIPHKSKAKNVGTINEHSVSDDKSIDQEER